MIIGLDMIKTYEMSLAFNPLRLTAVPPTLSHKKGTKQKVPKRINIPTCALASFDAAMFRFTAFTGSFSTPSRRYSVYGKTEAETWNGT